MLLQVRGIVLHKTKFKDTSYIIEFLSIEFGKFTAIIQGARKKLQDYGQFEIFNELDLQLKPPRSGDLYLILESSLISKHSENHNWETLKCKSAAVELYRQLIFTVEEAPALFELLLRYLDYIEKIECNQILLFWRFCYRLFHLLGIPLVGDKCVYCNDNIGAQYSGIERGFVCNSCAKKMIIPPIVLSREALAIWRRLPEIGNYLFSEKVSLSSKQEINQLIVLHLMHSYNTSYHINSLEL